MAPIVRQGKCQTCDKAPVNLHLRERGQVRGDGFRSRRGGGVAVFPAPLPEGGPVAQVGAPGALRQRGAPTRAPRDHERHGGSLLA